MVMLREESKRGSGSMMMGETGGENTHGNSPSINSNNHGWSGNQST